MSLEKKKLLLMVILPVVVLLAAVMGAFTMIAMKPDVETRAPIVVPPLGTPF